MCMRAALLQGALLHRCYESGAAEPVDIDAVCSPSVADTCDPGQSCLEYGHNPFGGTVHFDHISGALLTTFQCMTLEGWSDIMYMVMRGVGRDAAAFYFVLLVLFGSFYVVNLFLAVLWHTYRERQLQETKEGGTKQRWQGHKKWMVMVVQKGEGGFRDDVEKQSLLLQEAVRSDVRAAKAGDGRGRARVDSRSCGLQLHASCDQFIEGAPFRIFILGLVCANTCVMAMERYPRTEEEVLTQPALDELITLSNVVFTTLFAVEMALKLAVRGVQRYWDDPFDRFDGFVVLTGLAELWMVHVIDQDAAEGFGIQELRLFRLLRVFKLARSWRNLRVVLRSLLSSLAQMQYLVLILVLTIFIFAVMGMQLFGQQLTALADEAGGGPTDYSKLDLSRNIFGNFSNAMVTAFVIVSVENWNSYYSLTQEAVGGWCASYYIMLLIVGNYLVLNLVVAIVIGGYVDAAEQQEKHTAEIQAATDIQAAARGAQVRKMEPEVRVGAQGRAETRTCTGRIRQALCGWTDTRATYACFLFRPSHPLRRLSLSLVSKPIIPYTPLTFSGVLIGVILLTTIFSVFQTCDLIDQVQGRT